MSAVVDMMAARFGAKDGALAATTSVDTPLVEFRDVSKTYDGRSLAVAKMDCSVRRGEFLTFLGPSGSGKTTSLMMLAGFEAPTSGDILINGKSIVHTPPYRRNMGVVFQNYALFPHMTVAENIAFPLRARRQPRASIQGRVEHVLRLVRLAGRDDRRPTELSGGEQQRVALARALVFSPDVILMDEPLGALDRQLRERLQIEIKEIQRQLELTVIYVTHDQTEALAMSDQIAVFNNGAIQQRATPQTLYEEPCNAFVAQFIGENNSLNGVVSENDGMYCTVRTDGGRSMRGRLVGEARPGARVTVTVRPERIALWVAGDSNSNTFSARVREATYLGDHMRLRMRLDGDGDAIVKLPIATASSNLAVGQEMSLTFNADACRVFSGPKSAPRDTEKTTEP
ncbi:MAG TPA: ABC transporter ATP-binding protein [Rhizomicrobium sp.]|jgi:putative spermidine/putrescine transport system ATP-binding protein